MSDRPPRPSRAPRRRLLRWVATSLLIVVLGGAISFFLLQRGDLDHAMFYRRGKEVAGFLADYCDAFEEAHRSGRPAALVDLYAGNYSSPRRGRWRWQTDDQVLGVAVSVLAAEGSDDLTGSELGPELVRWVTGFDRIERTSCKIGLLERMEPEAGSTVLALIDVAGTDSAGAKVEERHRLRFHLEPRQGRLVIVRDELVDGVRLAGSGNGFLQPRASELGIGFVHRRDPRLARSREAPPPFGLMENAPGGVSAVDYDRDGRVDLFLTDGVESRLYRNRGNGWNGLPRFVDVTRRSGLEGIGEATVALFADVDNDTDSDLFVGRYLAPNLLFLNRGDGTFVESGADLGLDLSVPTTAATFLDYDRDGDLDLYLGLYGNAFETVPEVPFLAENGEANRLLRSADGERFEDVTAESGTGYRGWTLAVAAADYDDDGWIDLAVANDFGRKSLYRNRGDGSFADVARDAGVLDFSGGMGVSIGDLTGDGRLDLYTSNIYSNQRWFGAEPTVEQYIRNSLRSRWLLADLDSFREVVRLLGSDWRQVGQMVGSGNSLFVNQGGGTFVEAESGAQRAGWAWSAPLFDADNDGDLDVYVANGFISAQPSTDL